VNPPWPMYDRPMEQNAVTETTSAPDDLELEEEFLVEEISIDGMCGVY
jgi:mycofactocin precursor